MRWFRVHTNLTVGLALGVLLLTLTALRISGSSVGVWTEYLYGPGYDDPDLLAGKPRWVRGDEWLVTTALTAGQSEVAWSHVNPNVALGQEMSVLGDAPTDHWSTILKPHNWAFFLLPLEHAVAFKWWFRGFLLLFAAYIFFKRVLTRPGEPEFELLSLAAAGCLLLSPFIQWWYSTSALEAVAYFCLAMYSLIGLLQAQQSRPRPGYVALLAVSLVCAAITLYPPFLIPLAFLGLLLGGAYVANNRATIPPGGLRRTLLGLGIAAACLAVVMVAFYLSFDDVLSTIRNTVYPGQRAESGGDYGLSHLMNGFFNFLLLDTEHVPLEWVNQSEAATALLLIPWIAPLALYGMWRDLSRDHSVDWVVLALLAYSALRAAWLVIGLPPAIERALLLNLVPEGRALIGLNLANVALAFYLVSHKRSWLDRGGLAIAAASVLAAFLAHLYLGYALAADYPVFIGAKLNIWLAAAAVAVLATLLMLQRRAAFAGAILAFSAFTALTVNPLYQGLGPLTDSPMLDALSPYRESDPEARWVVYESINYGNYLLANDYPVLSSLHLYPQYDLWLQFDPPGRYDYVWNRYAHLWFAATPEPSSIEFTFHDFDSFAVVINPCHPLLGELNVHYYVFVGAEPDAPCLERIASELRIGEPIHVYRRTP